jgi:1-pyrroline-5-carboxylate dehydrogenase
MHQAFDEALEQVKAELGKTYPLIVGGKERQGGGTFEVRAPANRDLLLGVFQKGTRQDVDDAVAAAKAAYPAWSGLPYAERVRIMRRAAELIRERKFRLSALLILEAGKNRAEAIGEVEEGADLVDEYATQIDEQRGFERQLGSLDPAERNRSVLRPFGVWAVLAPFNFPHALSAGMSSGALVAGNTVVYKPASATPISGYELARCYLDAGVPDGVFNFVTGSGEEVGDALTRHPDVDGIVFTGSKEVGFGLLNEPTAAYPKPIITEMGGKNPAIVTRNADLDKAAEGIARSAFGFSGQKCSACSRVYVDRAVHDDLVGRLRERTGKLVVGDPSRRETFTGPVIHQSKVEDFRRAIDLSLSDGHIVAGGEVLSDGEYAHGYFVQPTVVDGLGHHHELMREEQFMPFVGLVDVDSLDEALTLANDTLYGLTAGIYTEDQEEAQRFLDGIEAGVVYVNRRAGATTGAWPGSQAFGGWKGSASTARGSGGPYYLQQYMREQAQTVIED